eukprot:Seg4769.5 transcript_id=Seg4769.5/GoldUCD/mRNA.D3Y31 product="hypothetical protein" protein_id=Seg4769.5/GoldUCD/D3Y31
MRCIAQDYLTTECPKKSLKLCHVHVSEEHQYRDCPNREADSNKENEEPEKLTEKETEKETEKKPTKKPLLKQHQLVKGLNHQRTKATLKLLLERISSLTKAKFTTHLKSAKKQ